MYIQEKIKTIQTWEDFARVCREIEKITIEKEDDDGNLRTYTVRGAELLSYFAEFSFLVISGENTPQLSERINHVLENKELGLGDAFARASENYQTQVIDYLRHQGVSDTQIAEHTGLGFPGPIGNMQEKVFRRLTGSENNSEDDILPGLVQVRPIKPKTGGLRRELVNQEVIRKAREIEKEPRKINTRPLSIDHDAPPDPEMGKALQIIEKLRGQGYSAKEIEEMIPELLKEA